MEAAVCLGAAVVPWIVFCILVAQWWDRRGQSFTGGLIVALVFSPLVGLLVGLVLGRNDRELERRALRFGQAKRCPRCAELVRADALVCRHCGFDFPPPLGAAPVPASSMEAGHAIPPVAPAPRLSRRAFVLVTLLICGGVLVLALLDPRRPSAGSTSNTRPTPALTPIAAAVASTPIASPALSPTSTVSDLIIIAEQLAVVEANWDRDWPTAVVALEKLAAVDPANPDWPDKLYAAYINHGDQLAAQGDVLRARWHYEQARNLDRMRGVAQEKLAALDTPQSGSAQQQLGAAAEAKAARIMQHLRTNFGTTTWYPAITSVWIQGDMLVVATNLGLNAAGRERAASICGAVSANYVYSRTAVSEFGPPELQRVRVASATGTTLVERNRVSDLCRS